MGYELAIYAIVMVVVAAASWYIAANAASGQPEQSDMSPNTLESMKATTAEEGSVVRIVFGFARVSGNILYYGNLQTTKITETVKGGKGGGKSQEISKGYEYYIDIWQSICMGPGVEILEIYSQDKPSDYSPTLFNPGDQAFYPNTISSYAAAMNPVAHAWFQQMYLGDNVSYVPTLHFFIWVTANDYLPVGFDGDMTYGVNPAAIIYAFLRISGEPEESINLSSFLAAKAYWDTKEYAINFVVNRREEARAIISRVFTYVDGNLRNDEDDKFYLKAWQHDDEAVEVLSDANDDFIKFSLTRRTWEDVYTDFRGNYVDKEKAFTTRTIQARNNAVRDMVGQEKTMTVDLTAFCDLDTASKRLWEIMKQHSYPEATLEFTTSLKYENLKVGDVIDVSHSGYNITNFECRIIDIDYAKAESNEMSFTAKQKLEGFISDGWMRAGESHFVPMDTTPQQPYDFRLFEMPYNPFSGSIAAFLVLVARQGVETSFSLHLSGSTDGVYDIISEWEYGVQNDMFYYHYDGTPAPENEPTWMKRGPIAFSSFSMTGTLTEDYPDTTFEIDDEIGIAFDSQRDDPFFLDSSREDLFKIARIIIINDEMMGFQFMSPEGSTGWRCTGVVRGVFNTPIQNHSIGAKIWITNLDDNLFIDKNNQYFLEAVTKYAKVVLSFPGSGSTSIAVCTPETVSYTKKSLKPSNPTQVVATRSGSNISVSVYPTAPLAKIGSGNQISSSSNLFYSLVTGSSQSWLLGSRIQYKIGSGGAIQTVNQSTLGADYPLSFSYSNAAAHNLYIRQAKNEDYGDWNYFNISTADGEYKSTWKELSPTGLDKILWGTQNFIEVMNRNTQRLNDTLLKIRGLSDVEFSSANDDYALQWSEADQKWKMVPRQE